MLLVCPCPSHPSISRCYKIPVPRPIQSKCGDKIPVNGGNKREEMKYSGERRLLGIGMMHKSNLVPVWDEDGAKEITAMKGNK